MQPRDYFRVLTLLSPLLLSQKMEAIMREGPYPTISALYDCIEPMLRSAKWDDEENVQALQNLIVFMSEDGSREASLHLFSSLHDAANKLVSTGKFSSAQISLIAWAFGRKKPKVELPLWISIMGAVRQWILHVQSMDSSSVSIEFSVSEVSRILWALSEAYVETSFGEKHQLFLSFAEFCTRIPQGLQFLASANILDIAALSGAYVKAGITTEQLDLHLLFAKLGEKLLVPHVSFNDAFLGIVKKKGQWWTSDRLSLKVMGHSGSAKKAAGEESLSLAGKQKEVVDAIEAIEVVEGAVDHSQQAPSSVTLDNSVEELLLLQRKRLEERKQRQTVDKQTAVRVLGDATPSSQSPARQTVATTGLSAPSQVVSVVPSSAPAQPSGVSRLVSSWFSTTDVESELSDSMNQQISRDTHITGPSLHSRPTVQGRRSSGGGSSGNRDADANHHHGQAFSESTYSLYLKHLASRTGSMSNGVNGAHGTSSVNDNSVIRPATISPGLAASFVKVGLALVHAKQWNGAFFALFRRAYLRMHSQIPPRDVSRLVTLNLAIQTLSPFPHLALGHLGLSQYALSIVNQQQQQTHRTNFKRIKGDSSSGVKNAQERLVLEPGEGVSLLSIPGLPLPILDPMKNVLSCFFAKPAYSNTPKVEAAITAYLVKEREKTLLPLDVLDSFNQSQFRYVTHDVLYFDWALPSKKIGLKIVTENMFDPYKQSMLPEIVTELEIAAKLGWRVALLATFDLPKLPKKANSQLLSGGGDLSAKFEAVIFKALDEVLQSKN
jgi:hypothetical protein